MFASVGLWLVAGIVLVVAALLGLRRRKPDDWAGLRSFYRRYVSWLALGLGATVLLTGVVGIGAERRHNKDAGAIDVIIYQTAQLLSLGLDGPGPDERSDRNPFLVVARVAAALLLVVVAGEVIGRVFRDSWRTGRLSRAKNHVVICGLGQIGQQLVDDLAKRRRSIVAIEPDQELPAVASARARGALVVHGDATDIETLREARVTKASEVFAVTGSDISNIEVVYETCELIEKEPGIAAQTPPPLGPDGRPAIHPIPPIVRCHVADPDLAAVLREQVSGLRRLTVDVTVFNAFRNSARNLFVDHMIADRPRRDGEKLHHVILGFGPMGQALALELSELSHFENDRRPRMTIVERNVSEASKRFVARYPRFAPEFGRIVPWAPSTVGDQWGDRTLRPPPDFQFNEGKAEEERAVEYVCNAAFDDLPDDVSDERFVRHLEDVYRDEQVKGAIFVCFEKDSDNFAVAKRLRAKLDQFGLATPLFVWLPTQPVLARLLGPPSTMTALPVPNPPHRLQSFGDCRQSCGYEHIGLTPTERLAQVFHEHYLSEFTPSPTSPEGQPWLLLGEGFRESNRSAAVHAHVKLAVLGYRMIPDGSVSQATRPSAALPAIDARQMEILSRMEHYRWLAERLLAGWRYGPRDNARKTRFDVCPWDTVKEKKKDAVQIEKLLAEIREARFHVEPIPERPSGGAS